MTKSDQTAKALRDMAEGDLHGQLQSLRQELWTQRLRARDGQLQQSHTINQLRRQIARLHTVLSERQVSTQQTQTKAKTA